MTSALLQPSREYGASSLPIRVVFADDSAAMRTLARYALSSAKGFDVVGEATNGSEAVDLAESHRPDCVVLDIEMPGTDGFSALAELGSRLPSIPVIMLSGFTDDALVERALGEGAVAMLNKTTEFKHLAASIQQATNRQATAQQTAAENATDLQTSGTAPAEAVPGPAAGATRPAAGATDSEVRRLEYVISHDLSEPLRIVTGFASLLKSRYGDQLDDTGRSFVEQIDEGAVRMQAMVDALLAYSRAGRTEPSFQLVDLGELVSTVYESLDARLSEHQVSRTTGDLPSVRCDPAMLTEVLRQLVLNAITFTTAPTPQVHISAHERGADVVITLDDNGIGVDPAHRERALGLFTRLNTRDEYPGTGAGLALCQRLMTLQGGQIRLDGSVSGGTTVSLTLPLVQSNEGDPS